jgi:SAM-dependent methyltransferase
VSPNPPPTIFSPARRAARLARSRGLRRRPGAADWLGEALVEDAIERIGFLRLTPRRALVIGEDAAALAAHLDRGGARVVAAAAGSFDEEQPWPFEGFGLIVSLATLDTVNDLPGALIHMRRALGPNGVAIASLVGAGSLPRLRKALLAADGERPAARIHPAVDARGGAGLLQRAGFARQVADAWTLRLRYGALDDLVADLRAQGLTSALASAAPPLTRAGLERAGAAFLEGADADGKIVETLEVLTLTGWNI